MGPIYYYLKLGNASYQFLLPGGSIGPAGVFNFNVVLAEVPGVARDQM